MALDAHNGGVASGHNRGFAAPGQFAGHHYDYDRPHYVGVGRTTTTAAGPTTTMVAAAACTQSCAEVNGLVVELSNLMFNVSSDNQFITPESGNVWVTVDVTFVNKSNSNQRVSPIDFKLRSAGVEHSYEFIGPCESWLGCGSHPWGLLWSQVPGLPGCSQPTDWDDRGLETGAPEDPRRSSLLGAQTSMSQLQWQGPLAGRVVSALDIAEGGLRSAVRREL